MFDSKKNYRVVDFDLFLLYHRYNASSTLRNIPPTNTR